ncbi:hypothetical protein CHS0354_013791 [Potamilus streckersoni]|uniref:Uncharacterized protein n=1 Tax=Potamilus streckersoni TaxID=2493646 RepID=A0AAE0SHL6_9BIVA|nr:hypothetical protein CHS0354_013791 [Potamilus streckersoni]
MDKGSGKQLETVLEEIQEESESTPISHESENTQNYSLNIKTRSDNKGLDSGRLLERSKESGSKKSEVITRINQVSSSKRNTSIIQDKQWDNLPPDQQNRYALQEKQNGNINGLLDMITGKENDAGNLASELKRSKTEDIYITTPKSNGDVYDSRMTQTSNEMKENNEEHYKKFQRQATEQSSLSSQYKSSVANPRPMSWKRGRTSFARPSSFSRDELEYFLPKRNFFSSHDIVLRDAGYEVEDTAKARQRALWKSKLNAIRAKMDLDIAQEHEKSTNSTDSNQLMKSQGVFLSTGNLSDFPSLADQDSVQQEDRLPKAATTTAAKKPQKLKKKPTDDFDEVRVDHKPLVEYLKFIRENPEEYMSMVHFTSSNQDHQHTDRLVRTARAFRRGHNGLLRNMSVVHHALSQLKLKHVDPGPPPTANKEKTNSGTNQEDDKTEIEKHKLKLDKWLRSINTVQLMKAKELALKEIGEEDINACWWITLQTCSYLRKAIMPSESAYF